MQKGTKKFCVHVKVYIFNLLIIFYYKYSVCCHFEKINEKKTLRK